MPGAPPASAAIREYRRPARAVRPGRGQPGSEGDGDGAYDAGAVEEAALRDPLGLLLRGAEVVVRLGSFGLALKADGWLGRSGPDVVRRRSQELRETLVALGPCYIKVGQALANRPDIIRDDYMAELEALQDRVPPFPTTEAMRILREELGGRDPGEVFAQLSAEPVAAASLGQVYRGRLRSSGAEVAVKVQRPGLKAKLVQDMYIFRQLAQLLNGWSQQHLGCNITLVVDEFGAKLWEESNYATEAQHAQDFERNFAGDPTVKIPRVFLEYSGRRVITMEWIQGVKSTDREGMRRARIDIDAFTRNGVQAALRQLLEFGLFHGDPHAGNVFAMAGGRVAYVDFGNVATVTQRQREVIVRALTHVSNRDYEEIVSDFVCLGFLRPGTDVTELAPAIADIWTDSLGTSVRDFTFRGIMTRFSKLMYQYPIRVPERFSLVFRALLQQEGICMCLNPEFSIIEVALPYASKRLLSDPDPSMRRELMSIVFREESGETGGRAVLQWEKVKGLVEMARQAQDGTSVRLNDIIVEFFRSARRDLLAAAGTPGAPTPAQALRTALEALTAGNRLRLSDLQQIIELLRPDITPDLAKQVADALLCDAVGDLLEAKGLEVTPAELGDPERLKRLLLQHPDRLLRLLTPLPA